MTISCIGPDGTDYNLLQDVSVTKLSPGVARSLGMEDDEEALVGVFSQSKDHSMNPSGGSAMCIFPMSEIERGFLVNIHSCFNGSVLTRDMDYIAGNIQDCPEPGKSGNIVSFCSETLKLNGTFPVLRPAVVTYPNTTLTSVALVASGKQTIAFAGTSAGHLKKISVSETGADEIDEYIVDEGRAILPDMIADRTQQHIYAASAYKIVKVKVPAQFHRSRSHTPRAPAVFKPAPASPSETSHYKPIVLPDIVVRPEIATRQPIRMLDTQPSPSPSKQAEAKKPMPSSSGSMRGSSQRSSSSDPSGARVLIPSAGKNSNASDDVGSASKDFSPLLVYFLPAAATGALVALLLIAFIGVRRKGSNSSTLSRDGNQLIWTTSIRDSKFPPPLVPSSAKPLPLIPLPDHDSIYSEISDFVQERTYAGTLVSGINRQLLKQRQEQSPRMNPYYQQQQQKQQQGKECNLETESSILIGNTANHVTRIPAYPPFFTFNTTTSSRVGDINSLNSFYRTRTPR
jgi:hypothetical protein